MTDQITQLERQLAEAWAEIERLREALRVFAEEDHFLSLIMAEEWLRAISTWLLETDNDMELPNGILDADPLDVAECIKRYVETTRAAIQGEPA